MIKFNLRGFFLLFDNLVNKQIYKILNYICIFSFFCLLPLIIDKNCYSADDCNFQKEKPEVKVDVYLVKETTVCPDGYRSYSDLDVSKTKRCDPIEYDQLEKIKYLGKSLAQKVPPEKIPLDEIAQELMNYDELVCSVENPCETPENRLAIVLAFEFKFIKESPKDVTVSLRRILPSSLMKYFSKFPNSANYYVEDKLDFGGRWLNHQRADLFLPGRKVKWKLTAGSYCWTFGTEYVE